MNKIKLFKPQGIFFDWDGTLVDSFAFLTKAHNAVKAGFGLPPFAGDEFLSYFGVPRDQLFLDVYGQYAEEAKHAFGNYYHDNHLKEMIVMEGAKEMLDIIAALQIPMGVVSNKRGDFLRAEVEYLGWNKYFGSAVVGAGDASADKPNPAPLMLGVSKYDNMDITDIWYVGDTQIDIECSRAAGCPCILVAPVGDTAQDGVYDKNYEQICGFLLQCP
jgi:phosphoglycolate phosphatase